MTLAQAFLTAGVALAGAALWALPADAAGFTPQWLLSQDLTYSLLTVARGDAVADDEAPVLEDPPPQPPTRTARLPEPATLGLAIVGFGGAGALILRGRAVAISPTYRPYRRR
jgi:hypothetical protein